MQQAESKQKRKSWIANVFLVLISFYVVFLLYQSVSYNYQLNRKIDSLKDDIARMNDEKMEFEALTVYYKTATFQELEARRKLGMKFPGEKVIQVALSQQSVSQNKIQAKADQATKKEDSNLAKWMSFLKGDLKKQ